jgi:hypothetical protein
MLFRQCRNIAALAAVRAALDLSVFGHEGVTDQTLAASKIDPDDWKACAVRCLLRANGLPTTGDLFSWQTRVAGILDEEAALSCRASACQFTPGKIKPQQRDGWNKPSARYLPHTAGVQPCLGGVPVQTVHAVKGETHDITIFVCSNRKSSDRCPSTVWWSDNRADQEEKRIAYVAMTRSCGELIVCVPETTYQRLAAQRAQFVGSFQCMTVDEFVFARKAQEWGPLEPAGYKATALNT